MRLNPKEQEKLMLHMAGNLAVFEDMNLSGNRYVVADSNEMVTVP